jgi:hypothetical protein
MNGLNTLSGNNKVVTHTKSTPLLALYGNRR